MKATINHNGELAAGIRPSSIEVTFDGVDLKKLIEVEDREEIKLRLSELGEFLLGDKPDSIFLEDEFY